MGLILVSNEYLINQFVFLFAGNIKLPNEDDSSDTEYSPAAHLMGNVEKDMPATGSISNFYFFLSFMI